MFAPLLVGFHNNLGVFPIEERSAHEGSSAGLSETSAHRCRRLATGRTETETHSAGEDYSDRQCASTKLCSPPRVMSSFGIDPLAFPV
jgi:hypothetical protein